MRDLVRIWSGQLRPADTGHDWENCNIEGGGENKHVKERKIVNKLGLQLGQPQGKLGYTVIPSQIFEKKEFDWVTKLEIECQDG